MELNSEKISLFKIPQEIFIHCILPFVDFFSKSRLKTTSRMFEKAVNQDFLKNESVKYELQKLLLTKYDENEIFTKKLLTKTLVERFCKLHEVQKNSKYLSRLWQYYVQKKEWKITEYPQQELKKTIHNIVTYDSLFGRKISFFGKNNESELKKYQMSFKNALELLIDLSQEKNIILNTQEKTKALTEQINLMIDSLAILVPLIKEKQSSTPEYLRNYYSGLLALYHYLYANLSPLGGNEYLIKKTSSIKKPNSTP